MIKPTIGRVVWLWPCTGVLEDKKIVHRDKTLPLAATVAYVWNDRMVNLAAVDQDGKPFHLTSVTLMQGDEPYSPEGSYCEWMPYQKGQAEKAATPATDAVSDLLQARPMVMATMFSAIQGDQPVGIVQPAPVAQVTDDMVSRFLAWPMPYHFNPDCFVAFDREKAEACKSWPTGTNLLDAIQARAMLEHVLAAAPVVTEPYLADGKTLNAGSTDVEPSLSPFDFGGALNVLRLGGKVARTGWNGKGMWVTMAGPIEGSTVNHEKFWSVNNAQFAKGQLSGCAVVNPYFTIKNTDNTISNWVPSTGDILALDWVTVQ